MNRLEPIPIKYEKTPDKFKYRRMMKSIMIEMNEVENRRRDRHLVSRIIGKGLFRVIFGFRSYVRVPNS